MLAGVLAVDRLNSEVLREPTSDEEDALYHAVALANTARWLNNRALGELVEQERAKLRAADGDPDGAA
jgi:hypothetical protein